MNRIIDITFQSEGSEPFDVEALKSHCSIATSDYDSVLTDLISVSRAKVERYTHLSLIDREVVMELEYYQPLKLPYSPNEITEVKMLKDQTNGVKEYEALDADEYLLTDGKEFSCNYCGYLIITYSVTPRTDKGLLYDVKRVANWLFHSEGKSSETMPMELLSNAKQYKMFSWH